MSCVAKDFNGRVADGCVDRRLSSWPAIDEVKVEMGDIDMLKLFETALDRPLTSTVISRPCEAMIATQLIGRSSVVVSSSSTVV